jgi:choline dehydrogenase-like flavoprotein
MTATGSVSAINLLTGGAGYSQAPIVTIGTFFAGLIDPAPYDILKDGNTSFTNMSQVDTTKLLYYLASRMGGHHAGATCKMGSLGDPTAVCDPNCAVLNTKGLRCIDMSVVPVSIRWPNGSMYVIGEKMAVFIRSLYGI